MFPSSFDMIHPWHQQQWRQITEHWQSRPNVWLFTGRENTGKIEFARFMAQVLLRETPKDNHEPCGTCMPYHLFAQKSHLDFYELTPEIPEGEAVGRKLLQIKIGAVCGIVDGIHLTSAHGGLRVVLVHPAEGMNFQAANSLLKVLEESSEHVVSLLVTHACDKLLSTIKGRYHQVVLPPPSHGQALHYPRERGVAQAEALLAFHSGTPLFEHAPESDELRAELFRLLATPYLLAVLDYAVAFDRQKQPLAVFIGWVQKWLLDVGSAQQKMPPLYYPECAVQSADTAVRTETAALFTLAGRLNTLSPYGYHTLSARMQLEHLLTDHLEFWQNKRVTP